jgi:hypothetical protein
MLSLSLSVRRFAQALEVIPRVLAENSGVKPKEVISKLYAAHSEGNKHIGFDIEGEGGDVKVGGLISQLLNAGHSEGEGGDVKVGELISQLLNAGHSEGEGGDVKVG